MIYLIGNLHIRERKMNYTIKEERLTAEEYIEFLKHTDLGVVRECAGQGIGTALV